MNHSYRQTWFATLALGSVLGLAACSNPKKAEPKTLLPPLSPTQGMPGSPGSPGSSSGGGLLGGKSNDASQLTAETFEQAYSLFGGDMGMTQNQLRSFAAKYGGGKVDPAMVTYLFDAKDKGTQHLPYRELKSRIPTIEWVQNGPIATSDVDAKLASAYPTANPRVRSEVAALIRRYDQKVALGDADQHLNLSELMAPGVILSLAGREGRHVLDRFGFVDRLGVADYRALALEEKVSQQLYGRFTPSVGNDALLNGSDSTLEWAQFMLLKDLVDRQVKGFAARQLSATDLPAFLASWSIKTDGVSAESWSKILGLYDQKISFVGDGNGKLNGQETLSLLMDFRFFGDVIAAFQGELTPQGAAKHLDQAKELATHYVYGPVLDNKDQKPVETFWKSFGEKTQPDLENVAFAFTTLSLTEALFAQFDKNHDRSLSRKEATLAVQGMGVTDPNEIDEKVGTIFQLDEELAPADAYDRLLQVVREQSKAPTN